MRTGILRSSIVIVAVGVLLGAAWAIREFRKPARGVVDVDGEEEPEPTETQPTFGQYFSLFFLGRTGDGTRVRKNKPLIRATKFLEGERVGIRAQTASGVTKAVRIELRFLTSDTREETDVLLKSRKRFTIQAGLSSHCCVRIPKGPGRYNIGIVTDNAYVGYIPITIKAAPKPGTGGLFAPAP
jgi:hypothetical protein